jgi:hypothetical protein
MIECKKIIQIENSLLVEFYRKFNSLVSAELNNNQQFEYNKIQYEHVDRFSYNDDNDIIQISNVDEMRTQCYYELDELNIELDDHENLSKLIELLDDLEFNRIVNSDSNIITLYSKIDSEIRNRNDYNEFDEKLVQNECETLANEYMIEHPLLSIESTEDWIEYNDYNQKIQYDYRVSLK